ncbi:MAG: LPXTG cell wall anchor domain-containing protein [Patescibacteria group bacterium]|nr:LPXTG cell wall anchor domain-containing protein [Patescibacteria group bacterium]
MKKITNILRSIPAVIIGFISGILLFGTLGLLWRRKKKKDHNKKIA